MVGFSWSPLDLSAQTNLGNVNSVRVGQLASGKEVILRCHPKGVNNGYFSAEAVASQLAKENGIPSYSTIAVHEFAGGEDFAFHVIEKLPGTAITKWFESHPEDESQLLVVMGKTMAQLHQIQVNGFGPFDNQKAKSGTLQGVHESLANSVQAGLAFNLSVLQAEGLFTEEQVVSVQELFSADNPLLQASTAVLVHNDFADWNLLTDGTSVSGVLDWDECVASHPVADLACWSTFFDPARLEGFLDGYWQLAEKPDNFTDLFELFRLRYVISKMTLRIRRYSWEPSDAIREKIAHGKKHLEASLRYFNL